MRFLGIDLGERRTGVAVGDDVTGTVAPVSVITQPRGPALVTELLAVIQCHEPHALVLGLPLNMDGSEGEAARAARTFGVQLAAATGLPVRFQDERLTSYAADQHMACTGRTHRQKRDLRDALAAAEVLRDYLARQR
jgi:putative holliday junction resolvase